MTQPGTVPPRTLCPPCASGCTCEPDDNGDLEPPQAIIADPGRSVAVTWTER